MKRPALEHGLEELFVLAREAGKPSAEEHARLARELSALQVATGPLTLREPSAIEGLERPSVDVSIPSEGAGRTATLVGTKGATVVGLGVVASLVLSISAAVLLPDRSAEPVDGARSAAAVGQTELPATEPTHHEHVVEPEPTASGVEAAATKLRLSSASQSSDGAHSAARKMADPAMLRPRRTPPASSPLLAEIRALEPVEAALRAGLPQRALQLLDGVRITQLVEHQSALRAIATCRAGRLSAGQRLAEEFQRRMPRSPFGHRVAAACRGGND